MKVSVTTQITIAAPPERVFKYLSNLKYHYLWNPQIQSISPIKTLKQGDTYSTTSIVLGVKIQAKNEITKFVSNKQLDMENKTGLVLYHASFKLNQKSKKTQVVCETTVSSENKAFAFATPVLKALARRELQTDLQALKLAVEHNLE